MLGTIQNPYNQIIHRDFGNNNRDFDIDKYYDTKRGNPLLRIPPQYAYIAKARYPDTLTKAGITKNIPPIPLPSQYVNIRYPQRSSSSHAIIDTDRVGVQLGMPDIYRDNPNSDWTRGIQYYSIYEGTNPKTQIEPIIYPQLLRPGVWNSEISITSGINKEYVQDITELSMDYSCKDCEIASANLGTPVPYITDNSGRYPLSIGNYTARQIGHSTRDYPQPVNPIVELQRRKGGYPPIPIPEDYDNRTLSWLMDGIKVT
jgi:hypothetical protein